MTAAEFERQVRRDAVIARVAHLFRLRRLRGDVPMPGRLLR